MGLREDILKQEDSIIWFSIIRFLYHDEMYIMVTNDLLKDVDYIIHSRDDVEVIDQHEYDGPNEWAIILLEKIKDNLVPIEASDVFNFISPCYLYDDLTLVHLHFERIIRSFNEAYANVANST